MSEEESQVSEVDDTQEKQAQWKSYSPGEYEALAGSLVQFSAKTVNSNVAGPGIRLSTEAALNLPYLSARTLMGAGVALPLDYLKGGAKQAGKMKQINAVIRSDPFAESASEAEVSAIRQSMKSAMAHPYAAGVDVVDARLRQILVPHEQYPGGYVSLTPITASGLCDWMLNETTGEVPLHNKKVVPEKQPDPPRKRQPDVRRIERAWFKVGGSKPHNVGWFGSSMQQPVIVSAPAQDSAIRLALSLYHRGVTLSLARHQELKGVVEAYQRFRKAFLQGSSEGAPVEHRMQERDLVNDICRVAEGIGRDALNCLVLNQDWLPQEHELESGHDGGYELVSRRVSGALRGLIDPRLRRLDFRRTVEGTEIDWPREIAQVIVQAITTYKHRNQGELVSLVVLDQFGKNSLIAMIEEFFQ